jgi:hypothetical protein
VLIASFISHKSVWQLTRFDIVCGALSLIGLAAWFITRHGDVAIFFSIIADALAATPTIRKSWADPESESSLVYLLSAIGAGITILTINDFTFANTAFAAYLFTVCAVLFVLIRFKPGLHFRRT